MGNADVCPGADIFPGLVPDVPVSGIQRLAAERGVVRGYRFKVKRIRPEMAQGLKEYVGDEYIFLSYHILLRLFYGAAAGYLYLIGRDYSFGLFDWPRL